MIICEKDVVSEVEGRCGEQRCRGGAKVTSSYSPTKGLTVAPAQALFEDPAPFSVKEILQRD